MNVTSHLRAIPAGAQRRPDGRALSVYYYGYFTAEAETV